MATAIVTLERSSPICESLLSGSAGIFSSGALRAIASSFSRSIVSERRSAALSIRLCRSGISPGSTRPRWRLEKARSSSCGRLASTVRPVSSAIQSAIDPAIALEVRFRKTPLICLSSPYSANPFTSADADRLMPRALTVRITGVFVAAAR